MEYFIDRKFGKYFKEFIVDIKGIKQDFVIIKDDSTELEDNKYNLPLCLEIVNTYFYEGALLTKYDKTGFFNEDLSYIEAELNEDIEILLQAKINSMVGKKYQHKNGNIYEVIYLTNTSDLNRIIEHPIDVVYKGENGNIWSRPLTDWNRSFKNYE